ANSQQGVNFRGGETVTKSLQTFGIGTGENAIIEGFISDALPVELALHVLVPVQTELGVIGKIGTELQEEGAEVAVQAVEVIVVDHGRGAHEPGVSAAGLRIAPLHGPEHRGPLLRLSHKDHALRLLEARSVLGGDIVLALPSLETHQGNAMIFHELLDPCYEPVSDRRHECCAGNLLASV